MTARGVLLDVDRDRAARRRVLHGVLHHVQDQPAQQILVAVKRDVGRSVRADGDAARGGEHVDRAPAVGDDFVQIQIDRPQRIAAGVGAREDEHVVDQPPQPLRLIAGDGHRFAVFGFVAPLVG